MAVLGALVELIVLARHRPIFGREWDIHALIAGALLAIVGTQVLALGICAHAYGTYFMGERDRWFDRMRARYQARARAAARRGHSVAGLVVGGVIVINWIEHGFGRLSEEQLRGPCRDADHRRHPDLLLVVPALDPRAAPSGLKRPRSLSGKTWSAAKSYADPPMTTRRIQRLARRAGLAQAEEMTALQARIAALEAHRDMTNASIRELQEWNTELARRIGDVEAQRLDEIARQLVEASRTVPGMANLKLERFDAGPAATVLGFSGAAAPAGPDASYLSFENTFRGSEELIASRQRIYVELLAGHAPVLDIGCGRGELLELLRDAGIAAWGVDLDPAMVEHSRAKGLEVGLDDAVSALTAVEDRSLGAVIANQVIEHLPHDELLQLFRAAPVKLQPDGVADRGDGQPTRSPSPEDVLGGPDPPVTRSFPRWCWPSVGIAASPRPTSFTRAPRETPSVIGSRPAITLSWPEWPTAAEPRPASPRPPKPGGPPPAPSQSAPRRGFAAATARRVASASDSATRSEIAAANPPGDVTRRWRCGSSPRPRAPTFVQMTGTPAAR